MRITNSEYIKANASIVTIISKRVPLSKGGRDYLTGSCPFHSSKSGKSFHVYPDRQSWYCFGCQEGGSVFDFLMKLEGISFPESLELAASECGITVEYDQDGNDVQGPRRQDVTTAIETACCHYQNSMTQEALDYLERRGISKTAIAKWRLGYVSGDSVKKCGAPEDLLIAAGVLRKSKDGQRVYDPLAGRISIPILDPLGRVIGFTARLMQPSADRPKYLNTGDTVLFQKGKSLFGFSHCKSILKLQPQMPVHIVEGQLKAIACIENGIAAVAPGGTAFTDQQAALLSTLGKIVAFCPDPDEAGHKAVRTNAPIARTAGLEVLVGTLVIPDNIETEIKDPDDLMAMGIPVRYEYESLVDWLYHRISYGKAVSIADAKRITDEILPVIYNHPLQTVQFIELKRLSELSGIPESRLAAPTTKDLAKQPEQPMVTTEPIIIDRSMPPERMLYAAVLCQGLNCPWQTMIPWTDLTGQQWSSLANIAHVLGVAAYYSIPVIEAINIAGKQTFHEYLRYWLHVPEAMTVSIAAIAAEVAIENRRSAAKYYASNGNLTYAQYLNHD